MGPVLLALISGVLGTGLGGALAMCFKTISHRTMSRLLHLTSGLMLAIVCFELLPEAMGMSVAVTCAGVFTGMLAMLVSDALISAKNGSSVWTTGVMVGVGIALHNLPEGLAVGAGYAEAPMLGMALCLTIALHDVPEGLAMALPLREGGVKAARVLLLTLLAGLPTMLGAALGMLAGRMSPDVLGFCLALAGGAMLQITCQNMLPEAQREAQGRVESLLLAIGVLLGGAVCFFLE